MNGDVGRHGRPDVLLIAEQLRRQVPGGIGTYLRGLLQGLAEIGSPTPRVGLVASRHGGPDPLARLRLPLELRREPARVLARAWGAGIGRAVEAPVVHAPSFLLPPRLRGRLAVTVHDLAFRTHPEAYPAHGRRWHERALERSLELAEVFVVPAAPVAEALVAAGAKRSQVHLIEEGSDHLPTPDTDGAAQLLERLGVGGGFLLTVGTLEPRKNLRRLFDAYAVSRTSLPSDLPLVVVGPTGWRDALGDSVPEGVVLAGKVDDAVLSALYRSARLFCAVPLEEGFCLPVVEAMRAGVPVVSSDVPSAGGATLLCDATSVDSIADAIVRAVTDEALRGELVRLGAARSGALTWRAAAEGHLALWQGLLGGERS